MTTWLRTLAVRLAALLHRQQLEGELDDELRHHLELMIEENLRRGMSLAEARRAARLGFGGIEQTKEMYRAQGGLPMIETLIQDLRYGLRMMARNPGFAAIAILALALGIGANSAIFSVVNGVLLRPLPYPDSQRLIQIWDTEERTHNRRAVVSPVNFLDWRKDNHTFEEMAAYSYDTFTLTGDSEPKLFNGLSISAGFTKLAGVNPILGRGFLEEEDQFHAPHVVILSYGLWQRQFGSDPQILGQTVRFNSEPYTIIGVMPADFYFPYRSVQLWTPLAADLNKRGRGSHYLYAAGRLKPGIALAQAQADMDSIARNLAQQYPDNNKGRGIALISMQEEMVGGVRPALLVMLGAVGLVLLIACANVANLLLGQAASRQKEIAIRAALGASWQRLIRQFLTESLLLAIAGGGLGLLLTYGGIKALIAYNPGNIPRAREIGIDLWVLGFTLAISLLTGIVFGLAPAWQFSRPDLNKSLKDAGNDNSIRLGRQRLRGALVVSEVALAMVLLVGAGLLVKSYIQLQEVNPGFDANNVLTMRMQLPQAKYTTSAQVAAFYKQTLEHVAALPGVLSAGVVNDLPFSGSRSMTSFEVAGRPPAPNEVRLADYRTASSDYFRTMSIPLLQGRLFADRDTVDAPLVAIIDQSMARRFWPNQDPIGQRIDLKGQIREIVGIVGDLKHEDLEADAAPEVYVPFAQRPAVQMFLAVKTAGEANNLLSPVRRAILSVDKDQPAFNWSPMSDRLSQFVAPWRFNAFLLAIFAVTALILATVGIYGVMAYSVTKRTHEIGIRMALGAQAGDVLRLVVGQGMTLCLLGLAIGLVAAIALTRVMASLLYKVSATDPAIFGGIGLLLGIVALLAAYLPARRATRVDPLIALRTE